MKNALWLLFVLLPGGCLAQIGGTAPTSSTGSHAQPSGPPALSRISTATSATTIEASFETAAFASPSLTCGTAAGSYTNLSVDSGVGTALIHQQIVAGLKPSTHYYCKITVKNAIDSALSTFTATTQAPQASTPITGLTIGPMQYYNNLNPKNQGTGDTFYNCKSNDSTTYITSDDNRGFMVSGQPANVATPMSLMKFLSEDPFVIQTVNPMKGYGTFLVYTAPDYLSSKNTGLFCMGGYLYMAIGRQGGQPGSKGTPTIDAGGAFPQRAGQIIWSADHGRSWNNFQNPRKFFPGGAETNPPASLMFGTTPTLFASAEFVHYCADDGTLGYTLACNQHDNGDAYVYLIANEGTWNGGGTRGGGNAFYIARVARAKLQDLNAAEYQWYTKGDGSLDSSWSNTQANATAIITNYGKLGEPNIQYFPALNRYLLLTFYYPQGVVGDSKNLTNSVWLGYEAPHPWGPWTLIHTSTWPGAYNPVVLNDTAYTGTTPTIMWTGDFANPANYTMRFATITLRTSGLRKSSSAVRNFKMACPAEEDQ